MTDNQTTILCLKNWLIEFFTLPASTEIIISEHNHGNSGEHHTDIIIKQQDEESIKYSVKKTAVEITYKDIKQLKKFSNFEKMKKVPVIGNIFRFFGLWFAFSGIYAIFSVCPFCGQAGCPVGAGSVGAVGGILAFVVQHGKTSINYIFKKIRNFQKT